jgi:IclR family acetate operon transcriptional repressor
MNRSCGDDSLASVAPVEQSAAGNDRGKPIQSVDRALDILEALAEARRGLSLRECSQQVGINTSTCHHILATLIRRGYVAQDSRSREYLLGNGIPELGEVRTRQFDWVSQTMPGLDELNEVTSEAVHLAIIQAGELVTLAKLPSRHAVRVDSGIVGKSNAAHATATGKVILAFMGETERRALLACRGFPRFTPQTICDPGQLEAELNRIREQGIAYDREEFQPGVVCIAAPIRNHTGQVIASVSCSMPLMRAGRGLEARVRDLVVSATAKISARLGYSQRFSAPCVGESRSQRL